MTEASTRGTLRLVLAAATLAVSLVVVASALADLGAVRDLPKMFAGKPALANSKEGRFIVRGERMVPGQKVRGQVRIKNRGSRTGVLYVLPRRAFDTPGLYGGPLSTKLLMAIRRVDRRGKLHTVWKGYLGEMGKVRIGVLKPGAVRRYRFVVRFRVHPPARGVFSDNGYQGSRFATDFVWRLVPLR